MSEPRDPKTAFDAVFSLINAGRIDEAEHSCRDGLQQHQDDINLMGLLGAILLKRERFDEAEILLRRSISLEPAFAKPHEDLGTLYLRLNRPHDAVPCFEKAVDLDPRQASALLGLATALARTGRQAEADRVQERFLALSPAGRALAEAARLRQDGHSDRAEKICGEILSKDPNNLRALRLLAKISSDNERFGPAEGLLRRVVQLAPDFHLGYSDLGEFLVERCRFNDAIDTFRKAIELQPALAELQRLLADTLFIVNKPNEALDAYQRCLDIDPMHLPAMMGRGHMQRIVGQRDAAVSSYLQSTSLQPAYGDAWWSLASIDGSLVTADQRQKMSTLLDSEDVDEHSRTALQFALAHAHEAIGDYDKAWSYFAQGNRARRRAVKYDPVETEVRNDARIAVFDRDLLQRLSTEPASTARPVFIVGMPRSGSTLIEQILASHNHVEGCGELPYIIMQSELLGASDPEGPRYPEIVRQMQSGDLRKLGDEYLARSTSHRTGNSAYFTDKMPANFMHVGLIHLMLPQAIIIDARRNPLDTCIGNFRQLFAKGKDQSYDLLELGEYYLEYDRLMEHWNKVLPGRVLRVQYEDIVGDLENQVRRILDHCALPFDSACLDFHKNSRPVNTASSDQVRQPIYTRAVGFWKNYEPHLDELKQILAPVLQ